MTKPKSSSLRDCIQPDCKGLAVASDKIESPSFNGWSRKMQCAKCDLKWKQIFHKGNLLRSEIGL